MLSRQLVSSVLKRNGIRKFCRNNSSRVSSEYIITSGVEDLEIPNITLPDFLEQHYVRFDKYTAVECIETKRSYTYAEVRSKSTNLAKALRKLLKLNEGDVVAIVLTNQPEFMIANIGILKANLIVTTVNPVYTPDEISFQFAQSDVKAVITEVQCAEKIAKALGDIKKSVPILCLKTKKDQHLPPNTINFNELLDVEVDYPHLKPGDPNSIAVMPFSSGTTGLPKGVELTHRNLVANITQNSHPGEDYKLDASGDFQEEVPLIMPLFHIFGYSVILNSISVRGGKFYTFPQFNPESFIRLLATNRKISLLYVVPPLVHFMNGFDIVKKEYLENLRIMLCGAAVLPAPDYERTHKKFGNHFKLLQGYGLTESSPAIISLYPKIMIDENVYKGSIGSLVANTEAKIVDPDDPTNTALPPNSTGELLARGPQVMKGYHNLPEETAKTITSDGWLRTGDLCSYNEDGLFFIKDRLKELIKVKGYQVAPAELEGVLRSFPGILEAAVIGVPHDMHGEVPRAYVVLKDDGVLDQERLHKFMQEKVAKHKQLLGGIAIVDEIPKNQSGKILRRSLRDKFLKNGK